MELVSAIVQRGAPGAANKTLKSLKTFMGWCAGQAVLDQSPAEGVPLPTKEVARDRVLDDTELTQVIFAARKIGGPYGAIVEFWRSPDSGAKKSLAFIGRSWTWLNGFGRSLKHAQRMPKRTSSTCRAGIGRAETRRPARAACLHAVGTKSFQDFTHAKRRLDQLSGVTGWRLHDLRRTCVSGMARLGVAPHVADKILNHQVGTISGVAAVYQRHEFLAERRAALDLWGAHVDRILGETSERRMDLKIVA